MGLVQEVVEPGQQITRALELAQVVAAQAPLAVRATLASARLSIAQSEEAPIQRLRPDLQTIMQLDFVQFAVSNRQPVAAWLNQRVALNRDRGEKRLSEKSIRPRDADAR